MPAGPDGCPLLAQGIRRQVRGPSEQFSPVILSNFMPVLTLSTFIEARYHVRPGTAAEGTHYQFVPIAFGISF